jgi:hypothetical protein
VPTWTCQRQCKNANQDDKAWLNQIGAQDRAVLMWPKDNGIIVNATDIHRFARDLCNSKATFVA